MDRENSAARTGQLLNLTALANDCILLYPYHDNFNKRLVETPKLYFYDVGLLPHLLQIHKPEELAINRLKERIGPKTPSPLLNYHPDYLA